MRKITLVVISTFLGFFCRSALLGGEVERVYVKHILFPSDEKAQAEEVLKELKNGEISWEEAVQKYSIDVYTKRAGGRLGGITPDSRVPKEIKDVIFKVPEKSYYDEPVKTERGWHILYVEKKEKVQKKTTEAPPATQKEKVQKEEKKPAAKLSVALELNRQNPSSVAELTLTITLRNSGDAPSFVFRPELLPFGVVLSRDPAAEKAPEVKQSWKEKIGKAAGSMIELGPGQGLIQEVKVGDVWEGVVGPGYWSLDFSGARLVQWIEDSKDSWAEALKKTEEFEKAQPVFQSLRAEKEANFDLHEIPFGERFYETDYYVVFTTGAGDQFLVKASKERLYSVQIRHFLNLVRKGFYNDRYFYKRQEGEFISGGAENTSGLFPSDTRLYRFVSASTLDRVSVKKGDFILVARPRLTIYEVNGHFMIALKDLPSYKRSGLPVGKVIGGWEAVKNLSSDKGWLRAYARKITSARLYLENELPAKWKSAVIASKGPAKPKGPLPVVRIHTKYGPIEMELYEDDAPNTVANFIELVEKGFYNGKPFHRVESYLIQGGSPNGDPLGNAGYYIKDEVNARRHEAGAVGMAKLPHKPNTASSQFYICKQNCFYLDELSEYTVFGKVTKGMEVVQKIKKGDKIDKIEVVRKRDHPYKAEKIPLPGKELPEKAESKAEKAKE